MAITDEELRNMNDYEIEQLAREINIFNKEKSLFSKEEKEQIHNEKKRRELQRVLRNQIEYFEKYVSPKCQKYELEDFKSLHPNAYNIGQQFIKSPWKKEPSLILGGKTGRGKTQFMWALGREIMKKYYNFYAFKIHKSKTLDDHILSSTREHGEYLSLMNNLKNIQILMLDDFGVERSTERIERDYYEIIDHRWEWELPTIISTNLGSKEIKEHFGDRVFSRFKDYIWVKFEGEDLRGSGR